MLEHVLKVTQACTTIDCVALLSPERDEAGADLLHIEDSGYDLNAALHHAVELVQSAGADRLLILPADLPRLQVEDLVAMVEASPLGIALAPDAAGLGTNAVALTVPTPFRFSFGPDSFSVHSRRAMEVGCGPVVVRRDGLVDLDRPADLGLLEGCAWAAVAGLEELATGRYP